MEPMFKLQESTTRLSKTELHIGGLKLYIYGLDEARKLRHKDIAVFYHAHGRTRSYRDSEAFVYEVLHQVESDERPKKAGLIAVVFDCRNHGERKVSFPRLIFDAHETDDDSLMI